MSVKMGQIFDKIEEPRVPYDEDSNNGLILGDKYLPEELIAEILCYADCKSLLNAQLVCKRWKNLMWTYVWRKKANIMVGRPFQNLKDVRWQAFYKICEKKPFNRNLIKNHSGQYGVEKHWDVHTQGGDHWKVECPPVGVPPLPSDEPMFQGDQYCFATSYYTCSKQQRINFPSEGLLPEILDKFQPPIVVSEYYSCRWDCPALYKCSVHLLDKKYQMLRTFDFETTIENDAQNKWHRVSHTFTNYGRGVHGVTFFHSGTDNLFWAGHYGSKMAGASVIVKLPEKEYNDDEIYNGNHCVAENNDVEHPERRTPSPTNQPYQNVLELD